MRTAALLLNQDLSLRLGERDIPVAQLGEVLLRVEWAGVCDSDVRVHMTGAGVSYWPATLGREMVGIVESCPGNELVVGTRAVIDSRVPCGDCVDCGEDTSRCENLGWVGEVCPGGFQGHLLIAVDRVVACPPELEPSIAALAEPLAVAMHAVKVVTEEPRQVRIIGYGPIASLVHREIGRRWPRAFVSVVEPTPQRRQIARAFGAVIEDEDYLVAPAQLVVDATGYSTSLLDAIRNCANGGTVLVVGVGQEPVAFVPAGLVARQVAMVAMNSFTGELPDAVAALTANADRYRPAVTEAVVLEEAVERLGALTNSPLAGELLERL